jgi:phasin
MLHCEKNVAMHKKQAYMPLRSNAAPNAAPRLIRYRLTGTRAGKIRRDQHERTDFMAKTEKVSETIEFPSFDASKATDQLRAFTEKGVQQSKEAYAKLKTGAENAQKALESSFETAKSAGSDLSLKTIAALRANAETDFAHLEALVGAGSVSELFELQTSYLRKRVELAVNQAKDLQSASAKAAEEVVKPVKDIFEKSVGELKVA